MWEKTFKSPKERQDFLMNLAIAAQFNLRNRGLVEYYGKDLISYKKDNPSDATRNEFLRLLSRFMTHHLEDNCPPSWRECTPSFWEQFIFTCIPHYIKITSHENQIETFLNELKKFISWLDKRARTSFYQVVSRMAEEAEPELKSCESLLNHLSFTGFSFNSSASSGPTHGY